MDEIELLVPVHLALVVLVDDPVARAAGGPRVDAEGHDPEVVPDGPPGLPPVRQLRNVLEARDRVISHARVLQRGAGSRTPAGRKTAPSDACRPHMRRTCESGC